MRLCFTIRELLLSVVIVAFTSGWWIDRSHWQWVLERDRGLESAAQAKVEQSNGTIRFLLEQNRSLGGRSFVGGFTDENGNLLEPQ
jgi:hypothetical protein